MELLHPNKTTIASYNDKSSLGIVLMQDKDITAVTVNTGALSDANEYQVHYHFLNGRFTFPDNSYVDVAIPTCYFNYKQEVSSSSVDFHLSDVDAMSTLLAPVANAKVNELLATDITERFRATLPGVGFEWLSVNLGTIHKHPGALNSFSGTDLNTSIANPGICFPLGAVEDNFDKPSFSSIILHKEGRSVIGHTEYRLANQVDNSINYYKGRCITLVHGKDIKPSNVEELLGILPTPTKYNSLDNVSAMPEFAKNLLKCFETLEYNASTDFVKEANVSVKTYTPVRYAGNSTTTHLYAPKKVVPHHTTARYKRVADLIFQEFALTLLQYHDLYQMSHSKVLEHYNEVEVAASYIPAVHTKFNTNTIRDIIALQNELWLETEDLNEEVDEDHPSWFVN